jgi:hypothetical protein
VLCSRRLAEPHSEAEREVLLKLLADEEAKELPPKNPFSSRVELHQGTVAHKGIEYGSATGFLNG